MRYTGFFWHCFSEVRDRSVSITEVTTYDSKQAYPVDAIDIHANAIIPTRRPFGLLGVTCQRQRNSTSNAR